MDDSKQDPKEEKEASSSPSSQIDLAELKGFSFGTQWSETSKSERSEARRGESRRERAPRTGKPAKQERRPPRSGSVPAGKSGAPDRRPSFKRGEEAKAGPESRSERRSSGHRPSAREGPPPPYESPVFEVVFYPEDACFAAIVKALRANHLTYELFDIAQMFLEKPARHIVSLRRRPAEEDPKTKTIVSAPDSFPFETEEEALRHVAERRADAFFDLEESEAEPPSGNFPFVNRCPFTKEILGPPNYHRYEEMLRRHHRLRLPRMPFEKLKNAMEAVRDEEAVEQWKQSMRKVTRYRTRPPEGEEPTVLDSVEDVYVHLKTHLREEAVKKLAFARVPGTLLEAYPDTEAARAARGELERQRRFPLATANAIRGRLRRERFAIYKKGSKGVTYVCAVKRRFRSPGEVLATPLDRIIRFIEENQVVKAKSFIEGFKAWLAEREPEATFEEKKALADLRWLVAEGYVTHYSDDTLAAQPPLENVPKAPRGAAGKTPQAAEPDSGENGPTPAAEAAPAPPPAPAAPEKPAEGAPAPENAAEPRTEPSETASPALSQPQEATSEAAASDASEASQPDAAASASQAETGSDSSPREPDRPRPEASADAYEPGASEPATPEPESGETESPEAPAETESEQRK